MQGNSWRLPGAFLCSVSRGDCQGYCGFRIDFSFLGDKALMFSCVLIHVHVANQCTPSGII